MAKTSPSPRVTVTIDLDRLVDGPDAAALAMRAAAIYARRRRRDRVFASCGIFAEPAWDILLALFAAAASGRAMTLAEAAGAAPVAPSTALRWIETLAGLLLVERTPDAGEGGLVRLSDRGVLLMTRTLRDDGRLDPGEEEVVMGDEDV